MLIIGYDPGGSGSNGVAILDIPDVGEPQAWTHTCNHVNQVLDWIVNRLNGRIPDAAGIDTYLSWATTESGWRSMDTLLRTTYPAVANSIFASNSASGSMAIQGMAMAMRLRSLWPEIQLNETHPKVLYYALSQQRYSFGQAMVNWLLNRFIPPINVGMGNEHEFDALLSAWATWMGATGQWNGNLMIRAQDLLFPAGDVTYYWT